MKIPELFHHLEYFSSEDYTQFEKFLKSPYYNNLQSYVEIFSVIRKNKNLITKKQYSLLKDRIMSSQKCSEGTTRKLISNLGDIAINYMKVKAIEADKLNSENLYNKYLLSKGYFSLMKKHIIDYSKLIQKEKEENDETKYLDYYHYDYASYCTSIDTNSKVRGDECSIDQHNHTLDSAKDLYIFTLAQVTFNYINSITQSIDSSYKFPMLFPLEMKNLFDAVGSKELKTFDKHQQALIGTYKRLYILFNDLNNDKAYGEYKKYFYSVRKLFNTDFTKTHLSVLHNYCNLRQRLNDKTNKYTEEGHKLIYEYIVNKMYTSETKKYLLPLNFRNFVITCTTPEKKRLLRKFTEEQIKFIHPSHRKEMQEYGNAFYNFLNRDYRKAMKNIITLGNTKFIYKYDILNLELKIYFETKNYEAMEKVLHNYRDIIQKEELFTKNDKESYNLMLDYFRMLNNAEKIYSSEKDITEYAILNKKILSDRRFAMRKWILNKIEERMKNTEKAKR
ncbi:MAG: hypothetical protein NTY74_04605 [Ignavibacteriae bacterium]|nr:hypothetical protein [Ignavibacteriota bacterium]